MSWTDAKDYFGKSDIAIFPIGSTEQHGPANPLGTDFLIAKAIAKETANRTDVLCLPVQASIISSFGEPSSYRLEHSRNTLERRACHCAITVFARL
jgi:creatinine amidohydrolase/Fe(II)-dependent formamide hydrolase-like protein